MLKCRENGNQIQKYGINLEILLLILKLFKQYTI